MRIVLIVVILAVIGIGAWFATAHKTEVPTVDEHTHEDGELHTHEGEEPEMESPENEPGDSDAPVGTDVGMEFPIPDDGNKDATDVTVVTYTSAGFSPQVVIIAVGDTVRFVNESGRSMWVGVDNHPTHALYDGTTLQEHCGSGGSFDQCTASASGTSWEFTFDKAGSFGYHNHVRASDGGTVNVQ